jgi:hypothetical protein
MQRKDIYVAQSLAMSSLSMMKFVASSSIKSKLRSSSPIPNTPGLSSAALGVNMNEFRRIRLRRSRMLIASSRIGVHESNSVELLDEPKSSEVLPSLDSLGLQQR